MDIQNLVREKIIGNIKTGTKSKNGFPQKLPYFNVEEDKVTSKEIVNIFKKLYPDKPTNLKIRFKSEDPFNFKFKRYVNGKAVCIGNDINAITIGKDSKGNNAQITIECNEECKERACGKCKLVGSLKFVLDGIEAGGLWKINTSGGFSLSNIATEIIKYKKAGMSIVDVPFELSLSAQESLAYGTYYSIDLKRTDIKPMLTDGATAVLNNDDNVKKEIKQLTEGEKEDEKKKETKKAKNESKKVTVETSKANQQNTETKAQIPEVIPQTESKEEKGADEFANYLMFKGSMPTIINNMKFDKLIFQDFNSQDVEYVLHPKASQDVIKYGVGTVIEIISSTIEMEHNILCKYNIKQIVGPDGRLKDFNSEEMKEAV